MSVQARTSPLKMCGLQGAAVTQKLSDTALIVIIRSKRKSI